MTTKSRTQGRPAFEEVAMRSCTQIQCTHVYMLVALKKVVFDAWLVFLSQITLW